VLLTFWAFPSSEEVWLSTLKLLLKTLRPRVYDAASEI
jgi:hypothetical protein